MTNKQINDLQKTYQKKIDEQTGDESQDESLGVEQLPQTELESTPGEPEQTDSSDNATAG